MSRQNFKAVNIPVSVNYKDNISFKNKQNKHEDKNKMAEIFSSIHPQLLHPAVQIASSIHTMCCTNSPYLFSMSF